MVIAFVSLYISTLFSLQKSVNVTEFPRQFCKSKEIIHLLCSFWHNRLHRVICKGAVFLKYVLNIVVVYVQRYDHMANSLVANPINDDIYTTSISGISRDKIGIKIENIVSCLLSVNQRASYPLKTDYSQVLTSKCTDGLPITV